MVETFIKDYAEVKKNEIKSEPKIRENIKEMAIAKINKAIFLRERGIITRDEAILAIVNCLNCF